jgi:uncharacterized membrane protein/glutaredoxin
MRRSSTPWIHRWSRLLIAGIALLGAIGTAYLTVIKLAGGSAACPTTGCEQVLNSRYATVFGLPLTIFGFLGYASIIALATGPLLINTETQKKLRIQAEAMTWPLLFMGATAMAVFSSYLMFVLATDLKVPCVYCIVSAVFTFSLFILSIIGHDWDDIGQLVFRGLIVGMVVLVGTLGIFATKPEPVSTNVLQPPTERPTLPGEGWPITTTSSESEIQLARHLTKIGAKEYKAWWCPHCHEQKQMFGKEAYKELTEIECDPNGKNARPDLCQAAGIQGYPTWEINGKLLSGAKFPDELAQLSGYTGPQDFQFKRDMFQQQSPQPAP